MNTMDKTSYCTQSEQVILKDVGNGYTANLSHGPVNRPESISSNNYVPCAMASASTQSSFNPWDLSSDDEEYLMTNNVTEATPGQSNAQHA